MPNERSLLEEEALKYHLTGQASVLEQAQKQQVELAPLSTPEGRYQRGLVDENDEATDEGRLFVDLLDAGLYDDSGQLTQKGQAFAMDPEEALMEQNLPAYIIREKSGLNEMPDTPFADTVSATAGYLWDAVKGTGRMIRQSPLLNPLWALPDGAEREAEDLLANQAFLEGAVNAPAQLGAGLTRLSEKAWLDPTEDEQAYYFSKQKFDRITREINDLEAADYAAVLSETQGAVMDKARQSAIEQVGAKRAGEIVQEGQASGALVGDPSNYLSAGAGALVAGAEKAPILARMSAKVEQSVQAGYRAEQALLTAQRAKLAADKLARGAQVAMQQADNLGSIGKTVNADRFRQVGTRLATQADEAQRAVPALEAAAKESAEHAARLAEASGGAQRVLATIDQMKQVGRQVRAAPAKVMGQALEGIGDGLMKADSWVDANLKTFSKLKGAAALVGIGTGNLSAAAPAAVLAAGPAVRGIGNYLRIIGDELAQARGTVPFWRRTAENTSATPLMRATSHAIDFATLGGKVPNVIGRTARGIAAAAPVDIGFEVLASGGDISPNTLKQGLAESLIFGGGGAFGGAVVKGNLAEMRARAAGDELNFRRSLSPEQSKVFNRMNPGARKSLGIYAATFPNLKFEVTESGPSSFNRATNTATINVNQADFLRPVIAHEVNHFLQVSGQIEEGVRAMLLGDGTTGGLLRSKDGKLDRNFSDFATAYNRRMTEGGMQPLDVNDLALEYFNEATVDYLMGDVESGKLQAQARRSRGEKAIRRIVEATVPKLPIIRNLFLRTGGALDAKGNMVPGNGLLAAGVRELPGARKMMRDVREAAMKRGSMRLPESKPVPVEITNPIDQRPVIDSMFSLYETDPDGNVIVDAKGVPQVINKDTEKARSTAGKDALKVIDAEIEAEAAALEGRQVADPEPIDPNDEIAIEEIRSETPEQKSRRVKRRENGKYEGTHLSPKAMQAIRKSQKLNKLQMANLRMLNRASRDMTGETFSVINHPALKTSDNGRKTYDALGATQREVVPIGFHINKNGAVSVSLMSVTQLVENIQNRAAAERGKRLYGGNELAIRNDVEAVIQLHREGQKTDGYFAGKYGARGPEYKNFINSVLDLATPEQRAKNPLFDEDSMTVKNKGVVKSYRIDRINQAVRLQGRTPLPFQYESVKLNLLPLGVPE